MEHKTTMETIRRLYDDVEGVYVEVGPDSDGLGMVQISTPDKKSKEWFGDIRLVLSPLRARILATMLLDAAIDSAAAKLPEGYK